MKDTLIILLSTLAFIFVLINNSLFVLLGLGIAIVSLALSLVLKSINIIALVSTIILSSLSVMIGLGWFIIQKC
jgi:hypothetical protein